MLSKSASFNNLILRNLWRTIEEACIGPLHSTAHPLDTEILMVAVTCLLLPIAAIKRDGDPVAGVAYDRVELVNFMRNGFAPLNQMCEWVRLSECEIWERTKALFLYFDFPFDAPAPE